MTDDAYRDALREIWQTARPVFEERVALLGTVAAAASCDTLSAALRKDGESAAHNLSGSLGTFGYGSLGALASEAEGILRGTGPLDAGRLAEIASALTVIVGADFVDP